MKWFGKKKEERNPHKDTAARKLSPKERKKVKLKIRVATLKAQLEAAEKALKNV